MVLDYTNIIERVSLPHKTRALAIARLCVYTQIQMLCFADKDSEHMSKCLITETSENKYSETKETTDGQFFPYMITFITFPVQIKLLCLLHC